MSVGSTMRPLSRQLAFFLCFVTLLSTAGLAQNSEIESLDRLAYYEVVSPRSEMITPASPELPDAVGAQTRITFQAFGSTFQLEIEPNQLYAPGAQIEWITPGGVIREDPPQAYFKGRLAGDDSSWVRLTIDQNEIEGVIRTAENWYFIAPSQRYGVQANPQSVLIYRLSDVLASDDPHLCAIGSDVSAADVTIAADLDPTRRTSPSRRPELDYQELSVDQLPTALPAGNLLEAEIHVVADGQYHARYGADSASRMASIINGVSGVYEEDLNVRISIGQSTVYTNETDPFTSSTNPSTLLNSFTVGEPHIQGFDLAHLFTGRNIDGGTVGIAWLSAVCSSHGTGISQDLSSADSRLVLTAHEMGHNFGSGHDGSSGHGCDYGYVMWPSVISSAREFSSCSQESMNAHIDSRSCLAVIGFAPEAPTNLRPAQ